MYYERVMVVFHQKPFAYIYIAHRLCHAKRVCTTYLLKIALGSKSSQSDSKCIGLGNLAGVFERYPNVRVAFGESGIGWIPYALDRMDFEYEDRFRDLMPMKPSEYWKRQCRATFQYDVIGPMLLNRNDLMTEDTLMWGSDYPHVDSTWPCSLEVLDEIFQDVPDQERQRITRENVERLYGLS